MSCLFWLGLQGGEGWRGWPELWVAGLYLSGLQTHGQLDHSY